MQPPVHPLLTGAAAVTTIAGQRIYSAGHALNTSGPYVTWFTVTGIPVADFDRPGFDNVRVQVDCYATNGNTCNQLATAVRDALEADGENEMVSWREYPFDVTTNTYRYSMDFSLWVER